MKIAILTHPLELNYGGNLQAFALQKVLKSMGHDVLTIDRHNRKGYNSFLINLLGYIKRNIQYYVFHKNIVTKWDPFMTDNQYSILSSETQKFINRNISLTRKVYSDELSFIDEEYQFDAYVVGSDQIWLSNYCPNSFLDFVHRPNIKKIAYAASTNEKTAFYNNSKLLKQCSVLAKDFKGISVREDYLVEKVKRKLGLEAEFVLDPTLLLDKSEYLKVIEECKDSSPIIFSYILDWNTSKNDILHNLLNDIHLPVVQGNLIDNSSNKSSDLKPYPSIDDWINNINRADFVVTDSFHGTVFAILFNKPFIAIENGRRGKNRFTSLLKMFNLEERLISEPNSSILTSIIHSEIDWKYVNAVLDAHRKKSFEFLQRSLS